MSKNIVGFCISPTPFYIRNDGTTYEGDPKLFYWSGKELTKKKNKALDFSDRKTAADFLWRSDNDNKFIDKFFGKKWRYGFIGKPGLA